MASDMFIKLAGITGESMDDKHKGEMDIMSWSWGMSNSGSAHIGGGAGSGKVSVQDLSFTKQVDKATTVLTHHCASGTHIKEGILVARKAGGKKPVEYLKIKLEDILITSYQTGMQGDTTPIESISLNFAKYTVYYQPQKEDGSADGGVIETTWDIKKNVKG